MPESESGLIHSKASLKSESCHRLRPLGRSSGERWILSSSAVRASSAFLREGGKGGLSSSARFDQETLFPLFEKSAHPSINGLTGTGAQQTACGQNHHRHPVGELQDGRGPFSDVWASVMVAHPEQSFALSTGQHYFHNHAPPLLLF